MKVSIEFIDDNGESIVKTASERDVPFWEEMEARGFRNAFHDIETTAALELTKETRDAAVEEYLVEASKKKRSQPNRQEATSSKKHI
jgi:hypothetical protein